MPRRLSDEPSVRTVRQETVLSKLAPVLLIASIAAFVVFSVLLVKQSMRGSMLDLRIYREATEGWLSGVDPYRNRWGAGHRYAFTYPPFALLLFSVFSVLDATFARVLWQAICLACLVAVCRISIARAIVVRSAMLSWAIVFAVSTAALCLDPIQHGLNLGQINLIILALIMYDALGRRGSTRGVLVGIATAIKLTPGIFILYFWLTGQRRAALLSAGTALGVSLATVVVAPQESWEYWTQYVSDTKRVGRVAYVADQSLRGVVGRAVGSAEPSPIIWLIVALPILFSGLWVARRLHQSGQHLLSVGICGATGLLVSPITWDHHGVWVIPVMIAVAKTPTLQPKWRLSLCSGMALMFWAGLPWRVRHDNVLGYRPENWYDFLLANSYVLGGVALLATILISIRREPSDEVVLGTATSRAQSAS